MKVSEMTCDQASEAMIRLSGPIARICEDEDAKAILDEIDRMGAEDAGPLAAVTKILPRLIAFGIQKHKGDLYEIVGALTMTPTAKIGGMNFVDTYNEVKNSWDDVLKSFFTSSAPRKRKTTTA